MKSKPSSISNTLEDTVFKWFLIGGGIFIIVIVVLFWYAETSLLVQLTFIPLLIIFWLFVAFHIKHILSRHFFSLSNVIESVRIGDFSLRIAPQETDSAWSEVYREINVLAEELQQDRRQFVEEGILLDKLLEEFDVPVFVFDRNNILRNINEQGRRLFAKSKNDLHGLQASQLNLTTLVQCNSGDIIEHWFPNQGGKWELRKNFFIQNGNQFQLLLVNDLSRTLREEERTAWLRLIRVMGHELNNSLASLISVSQSLITQMDDEKTPQWQARYEKALGLIHDRCSSLLRFTESYTRLAKLPEPNIQKVALKSTVERLCELVDGKFVIQNSTELHIDADADQLEQLLINVMKNAVEASPENSSVEICWQEYHQGTRIRIIDQGTGLPKSDNLFVPFYTTKASGSGIGLFLSRQIAEAHFGTMQLLNREDQSGCIAEIWLPKADR